MEKKLFELEQNIDKAVNNFEEKTGLMFIDTRCIY